MYFNQSSDCEVQHSLSILQAISVPSVQHVAGLAGRPSTNTLIHSFWIQEENQKLQHKQAGLGRVSPPPAANRAESGCVCVCVCVCVSVCVCVCVCVRGAQAYTPHYAQTARFRSYIRLNLDSLSLCVCVCVCTRARHMCVWLCVCVGMGVCG